MLRHRFASNAVAQGQEVKNVFVSKILTGTQQERLNCVRVNHLKNDC
jgi:hypothetical protein